MFCLESSNVFFFLSWTLRGMCVNIQDYLCLCRSSCQLCWRILDLLNTDHLLNTHQRQHIGYEEVFYKADRKTMNVMCTFCLEWSQLRIDIYSYLLGFYKQHVLKWMFVSVITTLNTSLTWTVVISLCTLVNINAPAATLSYETIWTAVVNTSIWAWK